MQRSSKPTFASCFPEVDCLFTNFMHEHRRTLLTGDAEASESSSCQSYGASRAPLAEALADYCAAKQDGDEDAASSAASGVVVALTEHLRQTTGQSPESADPSEPAMIAQLLREIARDVSDEAFHEPCNNGCEP